MSDANYFASLISTTTSSLQILLPLPDRRIYRVIENASTSLPTSAVLPDNFPTDVAAAGPVLSMSGRNRYLAPFMWTVGLAGIPVMIFAAYRLPTEHLSLQLLLLVLSTLFLASRITIKMPKFDSHISVSDTFVFLTMLL
jgi:hypothetical protein